MAPRWSQDGLDVLVARGKYRGVHLVSSNGEDLRQISDEPGVGYNARWSGDGNYIIVIIVEIDGEIYFASVDGSEVENLTNTADAIERHPNLSRDGSQLVSCDPDHHTAALLQESLGQAGLTDTQVWFSAIYLQKIEKADAAYQLLKGHETDDARILEERARLAVHGVSLQLVTCHAMQNNYDEAIHLYNECLQRYPEDVLKTIDCLCNRAEMKHRKGDYQAAIEDWRHIAKRFPTDEVAAEVVVSKSDQSRLPVVIPTGLCLRPGADDDFFFATATAEGYLVIRYMAFGNAVIFIALRACDFHFSSPSLTIRLCVPVLPEIMN